MMKTVRKSGNWFSRLTAAMVALVLMFGVGLVAPQHIEAGQCNTSIAGILNYEHDPEWIAKPPTKA